jgi:cell division transport system permease protein
MLDSSDIWDEQTSLARTTLSTVFPGADIAVVPQSEAKELLRPWLGNATLPDSLPVPGLVNITGENLSVPYAQTALDAAGLSTNIDDNSRYADELSGTARRLVSVGLGTLILILLAGLCVNIFATRAGMTAQKEIIRVLVQVGASDRFIAKLFIRQAFRRGAVGALFGLGLAAILWLCLSIFGDWGGLGWTGPGSSVIDMFWLIGLGIVFAIICAAAAGLTATRQLAFERKRL